MKGDYIYEQIYRKFEGEKNFGKWKKWSKKGWVKICTGNTWHFVERYNIRMGKNWANLCSVA